MTSQRDPSASPIDYEILEETAASLARVTRKLEDALAALARAEQEIAATPTPVPEVLAARAGLREQAAEWLWYVVVQREAIGAISHDALFETYQIPPDVRRRMGPKRTGETR